MPLAAHRWHAIADSRSPWEKEALDYLRAQLPDREPIRVWSNFEFIADDGSINEVDALVLTAAGLFLVEIKSRPGVIEGDSHTWTWRDGPTLFTTDNPILLANLKAKRLKSLLRRQKALHKQSVPFIEPLIFCSVAGQRLNLEGAAVLRVHLRDESPERARQGQPGIVKTLTEPGGGSTVGGLRRIDPTTARALTQAMSQAGIRPAHRARRIGDYKLETLITDGPTWQDWAATHVSIASLTRRVRLYRVPVGAPAELRQTIRRAAEREFQILQSVTHPGILKAIDFREDERGPALVFEHDPAARRLDLYMREQGTGLTVADRLQLLRDIVETVRYAHEKRLIHRALSPQTILVTPEDGVLPRRLQIFSWQTGGRSGDTDSSSTGISATSHPDQLVEDATTVYMAPESHVGSDTGERLDVFSLGALVWFVFTGKPPAESLLELTERLRAGPGLRLSSAMDGTNRNLEELVQYSTQPSVSDRLDSVGDVLQYLDIIERELLAPPVEPPFDPTEARAGAELGDRFVVTRRLGKGSTAVALLVKRDGREYVLKVAITPEQNDRLDAEADVLAQLRHQHIVRLHEKTEIGGRTVLVLEKAGDRTLAERLREEGRLHVELLHRLGDDLIEAVDSLESKGISHRDIKPDNLGVSNIGHSDRLELVLFDFSLSRVPAEQIRAGTVPYVDPFLSLRRPARWDRHAERYAVAVTLYEMATGTVPRWGDGQSDPAVIEDEVTIDPELFDPSLRDGLTAFFRKALRRAPEERFDNAREMLSAWRQVFLTSERTVPIPAEPAALTDPLTDSTQETILATLGLSTRALNALDRLNVSTGRALLSTPTTTIWAMRGVGHKTRRELGDLVKRLAERFPDVTAVTQVETPTEPRPEAGAAVQGIDLIVGRLVPTRSAAGATETRVLRLLLGLDCPAQAFETEWATQTEVAGATGVTRARVNQIVARARERWAKDPAVTSLRDTVAGELERNGFVMTGRELVDIVLARRGSLQVGDLRRRWGIAACRAAVETELRSADPRFLLRRTGPHLFVASNDEWVSYADRLGRTIDWLLESEPVVSPQRALDALRDLDLPPDADQLASPRLLALAAASSATGAVSPSRLEVYRRDLDAARALKLASSALVGVPELTVDDIRERVRGRYPEAAPLPDRPDLDALLAEAGLPSNWVSDAAKGKGAYRLPSSPSDTSSDLSSAGTIVPPASGPPAAITPEAAAARQFQERLQYAMKQGAFLTLSVAPRLARRAEQRLSRDFDVERVDLDSRLIAAMREESQEVGADWRTVIQTDAAGPGSPDWPLLLTLVRGAIKRLERSLATSSRTLLLVNPGLLARYDQLALLGNFAQRAGRRDSGLHGAWVVVPSGEVPSIAGQVLPVVTPGQMAIVPDRWAREAPAGPIASGV